MKMMIRHMHSACAYILLSHELTSDKAHLQLVPKVFGLSGERVMKRLRELLLSPPLTSSPLTVFRRYPGARFGVHFTVDRENVMAVPGLELSAHFASIKGT